MRLKLYIFSFITIILSSCHPYIAQKLITNGSVVQTDFLKTIEYQSLRNWIIVEASINGSSKKYKFLFDTGAVSVVTPKLMEELNLKAKAKQAVGSSNSQRQKTTFTILNTVNIAGIDFKDIGAVVIGFDSTPEISCLGEEIDGIIGANLMRYAVWQIDYQNETLTFSDSEEKLKIENKHYNIPFTSKGQSSPKVWMNMFGKKVKLTFDTGKTGGIGVNQKQLKEVNFESDTMNAVRGYGRGGSGVFGAEQDTSFVASVGGISINDFQLDTAIVSVGAKMGSLVGNTFLENYKVIFNWKSNHILLETIPNEKPATTFETFGFGYTLNDNQLIISYIFENSPIQLVGIPMNSQILAIDEQSFENINSEEFCAFRAKGLIDKEVKSLDLKYKTPDGEVKSVQLERMRLL